MKHIVIEPVRVIYNNKQMMNVENLQKFYVKNKVISKTVCITVFY